MRLICALLPLFLFACKDKSTQLNGYEPLPVALRSSSVDPALRRAVAALGRGVRRDARTIDDPIIDDPYVACLSDKAKLIPACRIRHRNLDVATNVLFWLQEPLRRRHALELADLRARAEPVWKDFRARFLREPLHREAIDLYALFPLFEPGPQARPMVDEIVRTMSAKGSWESYEIHGHPHRKITNEYWLVAALARNRVPSAVLERALIRKADEAKRVLHGNWQRWHALYRYYAVSHLFMTFLRAQEEGYDTSKFRRIMFDLEEWLAREGATASSGAGSTHRLAQTLYLLTQAGHPDEQKLGDLAAKLLKRQTEDGRFRSEGGIVEVRGAGAYFWSFDTVMAAVALQELSHYEERRDVREERDWERLVRPPVLVPPPADSPVEYRHVAGVKYVVRMPARQTHTLGKLREAYRSPENGPIFFSDKQLDRLESLARNEKDGDRLAELFRLRQIVRRRARFRPHPAITATATRHGLTLTLGLDLHGEGSRRDLLRKKISAAAALWSSTAVEGRRVRVRIVFRDAGTPDPARTYLPVALSGTGPMYTRRHGDASDLQTFWHADATPIGLAHEIGHFLGFADEYRLDLQDGSLYYVCDHPEQLMNCGYGPAVAERYVRTLLRAYSRGP